MKEKKQNKKVRTYRGFLYISLFLACACLFSIWYFDMYRQIPEKLKIRLGEEQVYQIGLPIKGEIQKLDKSGNAVGDVAVNGKGRTTLQKAESVGSDSLYVDFSDSVTMRADTVNHYRMDLKLFGIIPFKQVDIQVIRDKYLTPVGIPIGIYLKTEGVLVIEIGKFLGLDGAEKSPAEYLLKEGDYILQVNKKDVKGKKDFIQTVEESDGNPLVLTINRDGEEFDLSITPSFNQNGLPKLGIWVRDNAQGVGTMTFIDEEGNFGALGHGINDVDTSMVMNLDSGTLYATQIVGIKKGVKGAPGEMTGLIDYTQKNILGVIKKNTVCGIYGTCNEEMYEKISTEPIPLALKREVKLGHAQILCTVEDTPEYFDAEIKEIRLDHDNVNKGILLQITDKKLLEKTGGIIQGMSGAPIIQDGKLIGAVTHVLVNDSTKGYGIFAETMIEQE